MPLVRLLLSLLLVAPVALACGASAEGPPEPIWQEGPEGPVFGPSPLHLYPAALIVHKGVVRLPDRVVFASGFASLDTDGLQIVLIQGQRLRQLPDHSVTLFCGWSAAEERWLGESTARLLASERCRTVIGVYRGMEGMPARFYAERLVAPAEAPTGEAELQRSVAITVVGPEGAREIIETLDDPIGELLGRFGPHGSFEQDRRIGEYQISLTEFIHFRFGSAKLSYNARVILGTMADALTPGPDDYFLWPVCKQYPVESIVAANIVQSRCQKILEFLWDHGLCNRRAQIGDHSIVVTNHGLPNSTELPAQMDLMKITTKKFPHCH